MNGERIGWIALTIVVSLLGQIYGRSQAAKAFANAPVALTSEVRAYVDQKTAACAAAATERKPAQDATEAVRRLEAQLAALEQTSQLRAATQAKCNDVASEFRNLFAEQITVGAMMRDQEIGHLRNRTATTCAEVADTPTAPAKKRPLIK